LPHGEQEGLALAELRRAHADALAVAELVLVVEQVDNVEPQLSALAEADRDVLRDRGIDDGVVGQAEIVGRAQAAAEQDVGGNPSSPFLLGVERVGGACRECPALRVVEEDVVVGDIGQLLGAEVELRGVDVAADTGLGPCRLAAIAHHASALDFFAPLFQLFME
jgi:hypothetical protein